MYIYIYEYQTKTPNQTPKHKNSNHHLLYKFIQLTNPPSGANVNQTAATNRTEWPLTGGSMILDLHHKWEYLFINIGLGTEYPVTNISLTNDGPLNITGSGELCVPEFKLPNGVTVVDGQNATIQVVTTSNTGTALYNVSSPFSFSHPLSSHFLCVLRISHPIQKRQASS